jgi:hypothetical protein
MNDLQTNQQIGNENDIELNANPAKVEEPTKNDIFLLIKAKNKTDFTNNLNLFIKEGKIPPKFLDLSYEEYKQWKIKNNEEPIHLCEQDSIIYTNAYNDSRAKTDIELVDFEVWQRNLLSIAESERKKLTRGGLSGSSYNSYVALFSRKKEMECKETNLAAITQYKRFLPYNEENKRLLANAFVKVLYPSDLEEVENNIRVILSFNQFLRLSRFGTNIDTGLATDLQFFQNTQEGGKTTTGIKHSEAMKELGLTTCVSDLTKISGIYNSESGIGTSHICYFLEETYKNEMRIDFGKYEQMVKQMRNVGLNIKQGKIIPADSNACYIGGTNSTWNFGNRIYGYIIFDDGFIAREQDIVKAEELKDAWKTIFLLTPDITDIDWNIGSINMNRRIKTDKATTDLIRLIGEVFPDEDNLKVCETSYQKLQRRFFESSKNPNKYNWKKIIGELKKALSLGLINLNNDKFDNYTKITFNVDKDNFTNELLGLDKEYNYEKHYEEIVQKICLFFGVNPTEISSDNGGSYHSYQNIAMERFSVAKTQKDPAKNLLVENTDNCDNCDNSVFNPPLSPPINPKMGTEIHINPDTGKEFILTDFYTLKEVENVNINELHKNFRDIPYKEKLKLWEEKKQKNELNLIQKQMKTDLYKNNKRIPILTDDEKDLLYGNHIKGGSNELIGQHLSKLLYYGFYLDEIKDNWNQYREHKNHIKKFGEKILEENKFISWLSIEDYEEAVENGFEGKNIAIEKAVEPKQAQPAHKEQKMRETIKDVLVRPKEELDAIYEKVCKEAELKKEQQKMKRGTMPLYDNTPKSDNHIVADSNQTPEPLLTKEECDRVLEKLWGKAE